MQILLKYTLVLLPECSRKKSKLLSKYNLRNDKIVMDVGALGLDESSIVFTKSTPVYSKLLRSDHELIYFKQKRELVYNQNGPKNYVGNGGSLAVFKKKTKLKRSHFIFDSTSVDADNSLSEPTSSPEKTSTPVTVQSPDADNSLSEPTPSSEKISTSVAVQRPDSSLKQ